MYGWVATRSHEKVKGTQFCGKKDDLLIEESKVSPGSPLGSSRNRAIPFSYVTGGIMTGDVN